MKKELEPTTVFLRKLAASFAGKDQIYFREIMEALHERGFGVLLMVFILPNLLPIPGLTLIGSIPIIFFSAQMVIGLDHPWLPKWLDDKSISYFNFVKVVDKACHYLTKVEKFIRPRMLYMTEKMGERLTGAFCLILAVIFALPIPLANFLPVSAILIISIGLFNRDGITILVGFFTGVVGIIMTFVVVILFYAAALKATGFMGWDIFPH